MHSIPASLHSVNEPLPEETVVPSRPQKSSNPPPSVSLPILKHNTSLLPSITPAILDFNLDNVFDQDTSQSHENDDLYSFDTLTKQQSTFASTGNSNSTSTARSSNNESFSESPVSSAIHDDQNTDSNFQLQDSNFPLSDTNFPLSDPNFQLQDSNFPLPAEPGQINALKHRKSCASIASTSSHQLSLNHKASSVSSFSKSFSRPLSNSRPSSVVNLPATAPSAPLGIAIDRPPNGSAQNPTISQSIDSHFHDPSHNLKHFNLAQSPLHNSPRFPSAEFDPLSVHPATNPHPPHKTRPAILQTPSSSSINTPNNVNSCQSSINKPALNPQLHNHPSLTSVALPQRGSFSSQSIRNSARTSQEIKATGSRRNSSMTFVRRRSLLPQNIASAAAEERTGYYKEQVKALREMKRRRQEFEQDDKVLVGKTVSEGHVNYSIAYNMLTGIRVSVSRCNAKVDRKLVDADFSAKHKLAFDINGNELIPSSKYDFKFKDYAPLVFRHLRALFQLDPADYLMSLTNKYILSELSSPGKSGSIFYFSRDYRFIIKTIHHSEHKMLRKVLKDYYNHVKAYPNTLISRFYGLHRIKLPWGKKVHFIVMNNLFPPYYDLRRTYDLKGSTLGREYIPRTGSVKSTAVLKDLNWLKNKELLNLGPAKSKMLLTQLEHDTRLLKKLNVMDYSLLVGIYDLQTADQAPKHQSVYVVEPTHGENLKGRELRQAVNTASPTEMTTLDIGEYRYGDRNFCFYSDQGGFQSTDVADQPLSEVYFLGVIDCLTPYTFRKRVETFWKGLSHAHASISAIPATEYGDRFFGFMKSTIRGNGPPGTGSAKTGPDLGLSKSASTPPADPNHMARPGFPSSSAIDPNITQSKDTPSAEALLTLQHDGSAEALATAHQGPIAAGSAPAATKTAAADALCYAEPVASDK